ncbi:hypothetical protein [Mycobacterium sp. pR1184]|uniref:hypothetical protein n=1 Tax=Mycobacterium sp. pR1184 TaxID=3238981 RepID=UPI00351B0839
MKTQLTQCFSATVTMAVTLIAAPATSHADCGDPGQPPCTGPVPTTDQVLAVLTELTDPAANKNNIVTPGFTPEEAATIDDHLNQMNARGLLPLNWVVTDIQPAPNNFAGATITSTGTYYQRSAPGPIVLTNQGGHWLITHDTAKTAMDNTWYNANRPKPVSGNSI